jgi:hypothetical protein
VAFVAAAGILPALGASGHARPVGSAWRIQTLPHPAGGGVSYAEPGIAIANRTALISTATANAGVPPALWLSRDGGTTWSAGQDFDRAGVSTGDSDVAIGTDGYLYALNLAYNANPPGQPANPTVRVFRSRDGRHWLGPAMFPPPHGFDQPDRPWLFVDPKHPAHVYVVNSEGGGNVVVWRSTDHAATFTGPVPVTGGPNSEAALAFSNRPLFDPSNDRRIFMLYETITAAGLRQTMTAGPPVYEFPTTQLWLAVSTDAGAHWHSRLVLDTAASNSGLRDGVLGHLLVASAIDRSGNLYTAFSLRPAGSMQTTIYLMHSSDHGVEWSRPSSVPSPMSSNVMPALAVGPASAYLSWYGSPDPGFRSPNARWFEMFAATDDPLAAHPSFRVMSLTSEPVHVGGIDTAGAVANDLNSVSSKIGANWGLRDFQGIGVDGCGRPHPVWSVDHGQQVTQTAEPRGRCRGSQ